MILSLGDLSAISSIYLPFISSAELAITNAYTHRNRSANFTWTQWARMSYLCELHPHHLVSLYLFYTAYTIPSQLTKGTSSSTHFTNTGQLTELALPLSSRSGEPTH